MVVHMKMARVLAEGRNPERHEARWPASIRMSLRSLFAASAMLTSIPHGNAFTCFASADAVRQENPTAWPSWTMRAPGHEGNKCWYASTRAMAHDHRNPLLPAAESIGAREQPEREVDLTGSAAPGDAVRAPGPDIGSSFDDRFSPVHESGPPVAGSNLQRVIDLFSGRERPAAAGRAE